MREDGEIIRRDVSVRSVVNAVRFGQRAQEYVVLLTGPMKLQLRGAEFKTQYEAFVAGHGLTRAPSAFPPTQCLPGIDMEAG